MTVRAHEIAFKNLLLEVFNVDHLIRCLRDVPFLLSTHVIELHHIPWIHNGAVETRYTGFEPSKKLLSENFLMTHVVGLEGLEPSPVRVRAGNACVDTTSP